MQKVKNGDLCCFGTEALKDRNLSRSCLFLYFSHSIRYFFSFINEEAHAQRVLVTEGCTALEIERQDSNSYSFHSE
jgi:hypothetical protein